MEWLPPPQPAVATAPTTIVDPVTGEELPVHGDDDAPATSETCLPCRISKVHELFGGHFAILGGIV